jgi:hypothetical protein
MTLFRVLSSASALALGLLFSASPAAAGKPGDAKVEEPDKESGDQRLEIFDNNKAEAVCKVKGKICLRAASGTEAEGSEAAPVFKRPSSNPKGDWVLDFFGNFKKPAIAGNAQFIFSDSADSKASKTREVTALYQANLKAGGSVSARVRLSSDEGFRAGRTYHALVVQLLGGKEAILAEGDFQLK